MDQDDSKSQETNASSDQMGQSLSRPQTTLSWLPHSLKRSSTKKSLERASGIVRQNMEIHKEIQFKKLRECYPHDRLPREKVEKMADQPLAQQEFLAHRLDRIAQLRLKGNTPREITQIMAKEGYLTSIYDSKAPIQLNNVVDGLKLLSKLWQERATLNVGEYKGKMLAELEMVMRQGWAENRMSTVLECVKQIRQLLGLDAPIQIQVSEADLDKQIQDGMLELMKKGGVYSLEELAEALPPPEGEPQESSLPSPRPQVPEAW